MRSPLPNSLSGESIWWCFHHTLKCWSSMLSASLTSLPALITLKCLDFLCKCQFNANINIVSGMSSASLASLPAPSPSPSSSSSSTTTPIQVGQTPPSFFSPFSHFFPHFFHILLTFFFLSPTTHISNPSLHCIVRFILFRPRREAGFRGRRVKLMTL